MSNIANRIAKLEQHSGIQDTRIMWCEADWSEAENASRIEKFRQANKIPESTKIIFYSWQPIQGELQ